MKNTPIEPPTSAIIYLRVSTDMQASEGVGMESQERICRMHAERLGLPVVSVCRDDGVSGRVEPKARPGLTQALRMAKEVPGAVIVVYKLDRLGRTQRIVAELVADGLSVSSATQPFDTTTPIGRAMFGMIMVFAELEADMISERTRDGLAIVKAKGVKLGNKGIVEALGVELVGMIQSLYASGDYSYRTLAEYLNNTGVKKPTGDAWSIDTVRRAVHNGLPKSKKGIAAVLRGQA